MLLRCFGVPHFLWSTDPGFPSNSNLSSHIINTFSAFNTNNTDSTIEAFNPLPLTPRTITDTIPNSKITGNILPAFVDLYIDIISSSRVPQDTINTYAIASNTISSNGTNVNTNINTSAVWSNSQIKCKININTNTERLKRQHKHKDQNLSSQNWTLPRISCPPFPPPPIVNTFLSSLSNKTQQTSSIITTNKHWWQINTFTKLN